MKRYDITIIFDGEILKFGGIQDIREDSTNIRFKDKDEHQHNFHMVSYHIESYYPPLPKKISRQMFFKIETSQQS